MAEDNRDRPHGSDSPGQGLARTDQGASRSRQGLARTGQSAVRPQSGSDQPRQESVRPRQRSIPPPPGLDPALRESIRSQQEEERRRQEEQRRRQDADRAGQGSDRPPDGPEQRPRSRKRRRRGRGIGARVAGALLYVLFVIAASVVLATLGWTWACDLLGLNKEYTSVIITVTDDTRLDSIVDTLAENGLIEYKFLFKLYARFSHAEDKIAAGTYQLDTQMDYRALVANMGSSSTTRQTTDVTIPEGYTLDQIFNLLEEKGVSTVDKLRDMAANWDYAFDWLQDIHDGVQLGVVGDGDLDGRVLLIQPQQVAGPRPPHGGQDRGRPDDEQDVQQRPSHPGLDAGPPSGGLPGAGGPLRLVLRPVRFPLV